MFRNISIPRLRQAIAVPKPIAVRRFGGFSRLLSPIGVQSESAASGDDNKKDSNRAPSAADKNPDYKDQKSRNESKWRCCRKRFLAITAVGAATATVAYGCFAGVKELKKREANLLEKIQKLESYGLRSCLNAVLRTPYVPGRSKFAGLEDFTPDVVDILGDFDRPGLAKVLVINSLEKMGTLDAVQRHFSLQGRTVFDLTKEVGATKESFVAEIERMVPELRHREVSTDALLAAMTSIVSCTDRESRPILLLRIPKFEDHFRSEKLIQYGIAIGLRVVVLTQDVAVARELDKPSLSTRTRVVSYRESVDHVAKVEKYLLSDKSGIAKRFAKPENAKLVASAIGKDTEAIIDLVEFCGKNSENTPEKWFERNLYESHLRWLKAISTCPHLSFDFVRTIAFGENGFTIRIPYSQRHGDSDEDDVVKHLTANGILWKSWSHSDAFASAMMVLAWDTYTAKSLEMRSSKNISDLIIHANP